MLVVKCSWGNLEKWNSERTYCKRGHISPRPKKTHKELLSINDAAVRSVYDGCNSYKFSHPLCLNYHGSYVFRSRVKQDMRYAITLCFIQKQNLKKKKKKNAQELIFHLLMSERLFMHSKLISSSKFSIDINTREFLARGHNWPKPQCARMEYEQYACRPEMYSVDGSIWTSALFFFHIQPEGGSSFTPEFFRQS